MDSRVGGILTSDRILWAVHIEGRWFFQTPEEALFATSLTKPIVLLGPIL